MPPESTSQEPASYLVSTYLTEAELKDELIAVGSSSSFGCALFESSKNRGYLAFYTRFDYYTIKLGNYGALLWLRESGDTGSATVYALF